MAENALSIVIIVLGFVGIVLLSALLATPAPKHAIVKTFIVTALVRSIVSVIPAILFQATPDDLEAFSKHPMTLAFCTADAIILRYLNLTMAAFSISFTLPLLYLCCKFVQDPDHAEYNRDQPFYRLTTAALAFGPFVWGLPSVLASLPALSHGIAHAKSEFALSAICTINDTVSETVTLVLLVAALAFATIFAVVFMFFLWKTIKLPLFSHNLGRLDITQLLRFAVLFCIFLLSVILYSIITAQWIRWTSNETVTNPLLKASLQVSIIWESVTPILYFFIFAAHEEVFVVWKAWSRGFRRPRSGEFPPEPTTGRSWWRRNHAAASGDYLYSHARSKPSLAQSDIYGDPPALEPLQMISQPIVQRTMLDHHINSLSTFQQPASLPSVGLPPPPRPAGSPSTSPIKTAPSEFSLVTAPSLTAFGSNKSSNELSRKSGVEKRTAGGRQCAKSSSGRLSHRPSTADTFGNAGDNDRDSGSCVTEQTHAS